jgi:RNA polymerase sigma factor (sigma-70 family)
MPKAAPSPILKLIRGLADDPRVQRLTDQELLGRFRTGRDDLAFHSLVRRHGSMVLDVCRTVLGNEADAEDAFQATFLILTQKAAAIRKLASVGSWLYGVAYRTALKAQAEGARRKKHEARAPGRASAGRADDLSWREVRQIVHATLNGLSECYRAPLVLCYLEGTTQDEAAKALGVSKATVNKRLERGRALLHVRLLRHGLGSVTLLAAAAWPGSSSAGLPPTLLASTARAANLIAAGHAATGATSPTVAALTRRVMRTMVFTKLKTATAVLLALSFLAAGLLLAGPAVRESEDGPLVARVVAVAPTRGAQAGAEMVKADAIVKDGKHINSLAFCNGGETVAAVVWRTLPKVDSQPSAVVLWDVRTGKVAHTLEQFDQGFLYQTVTASPDGKTVAAVAGSVKDATITLWEAKTGKLVQSITHDGAGIERIALSPDGKRLAGCAHINHALLWDVESGKLLKTFETRDMDFWSVAVAPDGKLVAAGGEVRELTGEGKVVVWEVETGKVKHELSEAKMGTVATAAFSPDGKLLAAGGSNEDTVRVWEVETGHLKCRLKAQGIAELAWSPNGKALATAGWDGKIRVWDVAQEKPVHTFDGHGKHAYGEFVHTVSFAPEGRRVVSGGWDGTMRFWRLAPAGGGKRP